MFETAPPSDKIFLLPSLRNAVVSALRTLNEATGVVTPATGYAGGGGVAMNSCRDLFVIASHTMPIRKKKIVRRAFRLVAK